jgi:hypothetical protein
MLHPEIQKDWIQLGTCHTQRSLFFLRSDSSLSYTVFKSTCNCFRTCAFLQDALDQAIAGDTVILCPGIHNVSSTGGLEEGGNIMGNASVNVI